MTSRYFSDLDKYAGVCCVSVAYLPILPSQQVLLLA